MLNPKCKILNAIVVMADDPFTTNDLINVTSALTIVDGDIVYSDGSIISCEGELNYEWEPTRNE